MRSLVKKGLLKAAFAVAAGAALAGAGAIPALAIIPAAVISLQSFVMHFVEAKATANLPPGVPLAADEIAFVRSIFGREIDKGDLLRVRKYFRAKEGKRAAAGVQGLKRINFYGTANHEEDYSRSKDAFNYGTFIHEMVHIWQKSRLLPLFIQRCHRPRTYDYELSSRSRFKDFGHEQQACIIEDYARRFLFPFADIKARRIDTTPENDILLQRVVEKNFPSARKARLRMADKKKEQARAAAFSESYDWFPQKPVIGRKLAAARL